MSWKQVFQSVVALLLIVAFAAVLYAPALACPGGSCSTGYGGWSNDIHYHSGVASTEGSGPLAKLRERLHRHHASASCAEPSCQAAAWCAVSDQWDRPPGERGTEPSCGCPASEAAPVGEAAPSAKATSKINRPPIVVGHAAVVTVRELAPDIEPSPGSVASLRQ